MNGFSARLDVDADRDGIVEPGEPGRWDWEWSSNGVGAVVIPDLGQHGAEGPELAELRLVTEGKTTGVRLGLSISDDSADRITIHRRLPDGALRPLVGRLASVNGAPATLGMPLDPSGETLWLQAHTHPGSGFDGLVEIVLVELQNQRTPTGSTLVPFEIDKVVFRVAPWIMTPNTLPPSCVYAVRFKDVSGEFTIENEEFLSGLRSACQQANVELRILEGPVGIDQWMQDEVEFGYSQAPGRIVDIVCDGPRNRPLDFAAEAGLLGKGLGVVEVRSHLGTRTSLDSFGNLEVSPPVTVGNQRYPLGRIVIGSKRRGPSESQLDRKASLALRKFLYGQEVQAPFDTYTDWLAVGHIDEIISFVPAPNAIGFQVLIASPARCERLLREWAAQGHDDAMLWSGQKRIRWAPDGSIEALDPAEETLSELLGRAQLWEHNHRCQEHLNGVREDLRTNLGVGEDAFIEIPVAFKDEGGRALAYFPDMVNHLVLGNISVVPRPYGPRVEEVDLLEQAFTDALPHQSVIFIDDWLPYHEMSGEVHCGTNVRRKADGTIGWWEHRLPGLWNASAPRPD